MAKSPEVSPISSDVERSHSTANVGDSPFGVNISYPETVTIRMVDASGLGDYEFSILIAGFFCNASVGFLVAAMTLTEDQQLMWILTAIFAVVTALFVGWAFVKRGNMNRRAKTVRLVGATVE